MAIRSVKNIFAPLFAGNDALSPALAYAMSLAESAEAHLTVRGMSERIESLAHLFPDVVEPAIGGANEEAWRAIDKATDAARLALDARSIRYDVAVVQRSRSEIEKLMEDEARIHDLTIMDAGADDSIAVKRAEDLLFLSGRPIILVPRNVIDFRCDVVVVAYDGSHTASRAVGDAMPFLLQAKRVKIVQVVDDVCCRKPAGAHLADSLNRHGVIAYFDEIERAIGGDVPKTIDDYARDQFADMLVMGAFAHWRWREVILGGVTHAMMKHIKLPTLMSH